jgi:putative transposase
MLIRRIAMLCGACFTLQVDIVARPCQLQAGGSAPAEFVFCDHTIDITYIRLVAGWMYLVAVLDLYARYVVSWALDDTLEQSFVLDAVNRALVVATPQIWNSDQGSHFTSPQYTGLLDAAGVQISMDGRGRALDNIFIERLWRSVKYEEVYLTEYGAPREARIGLGRYLTHYNDDRPHSTLGYQTREAVYFGKEQIAPAR